MALTRNSLYAHPRTTSHALAVGLAMQFTQSSLQAQKFIKMCSDGVIPGFKNRPGNCQKQERVVLNAV